MIQVTMVRAPPAFFNDRCYVQRSLCLLLPNQELPGLNTKGRGYVLDDRHSIQHLFPHHLEQWAPPLSLGY